MTLSGVAPFSIIFLLIGYGSASLWSNQKVSPYEHFLHTIFWYVKFLLLSPNDKERTQRLP